MAKEREKKLGDLLAKARELSSEETISPEQAKELDQIMVDAKSLQGRIATDRSIDEFTRTISEDAPAKSVGSRETYIAQDGAFGVYADREGYAAATKAWKSGNGAEKQWGFDVRYKAVPSGATAETNAGALTLQGTDPGEQYGGAVSPFYYPGIVEPPTRQPLVADLFAQGSTDSNLVRLVKETVTTQGAAATAEGSTYGTSKIEVAPIDWPVKDITTLLPVTEDALADIPAMSAYLGMRLAKFVQLKEEEELLTGDGTGSHLIGVQHTVGRTVSAQGADDLATAILKLNAKVYKNSFLDPSWVLMSPTTWASYAGIRTDLNGGKGQFLSGPPNLAAVRNIWGLPITVSALVPDDRIFVGNPAAGMIFRNGGLRVESSTGYGTYFGEGLVAIRGKVRTAFAVFRPQAIGELIVGS